MVVALLVLPKVAARVKAPPPTTTTETILVKALLSFSKLLLRRKRKTKKVMMVRVKRTKKGKRSKKIRNKKKGMHQKKKKTSQQKERRERVKKIIIMSDELKQRGNEAFKQNDFKLACELFTEAIGLDSTNHVLYSNRSAARVIFIMYFLCIQLYTFSKRFSIVFI